MPGETGRGAACPKSIKRAKQLKYENVQLSSF